MLTNPTIATLLATIARPEATATDLLILALRLSLGLVILPHGAQKLLGWFGGFGFRGTMGYFTGTMRIPYAFGLLAEGAEDAGL